MDITGRGGVGVITSASNQLWRLTLLLPWFGNFVQDPSLFLPTTHFFVYRDRIVSYNRCTKHSSRWPGSPELYVRSLFLERWAVFNRSILIASAFASINGLHSSPSNHTSTSDLPRNRSTPQNIIHRFGSFIASISRGSGLF